MLKVISEKKHNGVWLVVEDKGIYSVAFKLPIEGQTPSDNFDNDDIKEHFNEIKTFENSDDFIEYQNRVIDLSLLKKLLATEIPTNTGYLSIGINSKDMRFNHEDSTEYTVRKMINFAISQAIEHGVPIPEDIEIDYCTDDSAS